MILEERLSLAEESTLVEEGRYTAWVNTVPGSLSPSAFLHPPPLMLMMMPVPTPPTQRMPLLTAASVERCQYRSKFCRNHRAIKANGAMHRLCEFHRYKANVNQKRWTQARRADDNACQHDAKSVAADSATASGRSRSRRRHQLIDKTHTPKLDSGLSPMPMWPYAPYWPMESMTDYHAVANTKAGIAPPLSGMDLDMLAALLVDAEPKSPTAEQETVV